MAKIKFRYVENITKESEITLDVPDGIASDTHETLEFFEDAKMNDAEFYDNLIELNATVTYASVSIVSDDAEGNAR